MPSWDAFVLCDGGLDEILLLFKHCASALTAPLIRSDPALTAPSLRLLASTMAQKDGVCKGSPPPLGYALLLDFIIL